MHLGFDKDVYMNFRFRASSTGCGQSLVSGVGCYPICIGQSGTPDLAGWKTAKSLTLNLHCMLISIVASAQGKL